MAQGPAGDSSRPQVSGHKEPAARRGLRLLTQQPALGGCSAHPEPGPTLVSPHPQQLHFWEVPASEFLKPPQEGVPVGGSLQRIPACVGTAFWVDPSFLTTSKSRAQKAPLFSPMLSCSSEKRVQSRMRMCRPHSPTRLQGSLVDSACKVRLHFLYSPTQTQIHTKHIKHQALYIYIYICDTPSWGTHSSRKDI